jgi:hypothetical protein
MPYDVRSAGDGKFEVVNSHTGKVKAKHTTKEKAEAQVRLLHMIEHGKEPVNV